MGLGGVCGGWECPGWGSVQILGCLWQEFEVWLGLGVGGLWLGPWRVIPLIAIGFPLRNPAGCCPSGQGQSQGGPPQLPTPPDPAAVLKRGSHLGGEEQQPSMGGWVQVVAADLGQWPPSSVAAVNSPMPLRDRTETGSVLLPKHSAPKVSGAAGQACPRLLSRWGEGA